MGISLKGFGDASGQGATIAGLTALPPAASEVRLPAGGANGLPWQTLMDAESTLFYVSLTGNDTTGDGTQGNPYATIDKALAETTDGGIVLESGTHTNNANDAGTIRGGLTDENKPVRYYAGTTDADVKVIVGKETGASGVYFSAYAMENAASALYGLILDYDVTGITLNYQKPIFATNYSGNVTSRGTVYNCVFNVIGGSGAVDYQHNIPVINSCSFSASSWIASYQDSGTIAFNYTASSGTSWQHENIETNHVDDATFDADWHITAGGNDASRGVYSGTYSWDVVAGQDQYEAAYDFANHPYKTTYQGHANLTYVDGLANPFIEDGTASKAYTTIEAALDSFSASGGTIALAGNTWTIDGTDQDATPGQGALRDSNKPIIFYGVANETKLTVNKDLHAYANSWACEHADTEMYAVHVTQETGTTTANHQRAVFSNYNDPCRGTLYNCVFTSLDKGMALFYNNVGTNNLTVNNCTFFLPIGQSWDVSYSGTAGNTLNNCAVVEASFKETEGTQNSTVEGVTLDANFNITAGGSNATHGVYSGTEAWS